MGMLAEGLFLYEHGYFAQELRDDLTQEYNFGLYRNWQLRKTKSCCGKVTGNYLRIF